MKLLLPFQRAIGDDSINASNEGKATKRRRSEDFDYFQRNELTSKDTGKDMFSRAQRTDSNAKDGEFQLKKNMSIESY